MAKLSSRALRVLVFLSVVGWLAAPSLATPDPTPARKAGTASDKSPAAEGTAGKEGTPAPTAKPTASQEACKASVEKLRSGDPSAVGALSENQRGTLLLGATGIDAVTCLAVAEDDQELCDLLDEDGRKVCLEQWKVGRELKGLSKEKVKAQLMYRTCASNSPKLNCELVREAVGSGDAATCKELTEPSVQAFCTAVVTGDAKKCDAVPAGAERSYCAAFAADDASRCPKEATDCIALARGFAAMKKGGLDGFEDIDARIAAASMGTKACALLLDKVEKACGESE